MSGSEIVSGTRVRYFQPDADGILAAWSGRKPQTGEILTATVTRVTAEAGTTFYRTAEGVLLTDADLRGVVA